ncbi:MAG: hypothetical protein PHN75_06420, partial [Syntrophales bacterium]|nr:hypothetical protein [Syntrophales bacterium]
IKDIVALFEKIVGRKLNVRLGERPYRKREVMHPWSEGQVLPGWQPKVSLPSGIAELVAKGGKR